jgi:hypothetical protein
MREELPAAFASRRATARASVLPKHQTSGGSLSSTPVSAEVFWRLVDRYARLRRFELEAAREELALFGTGVLRVHPNGRIEHVPLKHLDKVP